MSEQTAEIVKCMHCDKPFNYTGVGTSNCCTDCMRGHDAGELLDNINLVESTSTHFNTTAKAVMYGITSHTSKEVYAFVMPATEVLIFAASLTKAAKAALGET